MQPPLVPHASHTHEIGLDRRVCGCSWLVAVIMHNDKTFFSIRLDEKHNDKQLLHQLDEFGLGWAPIEYWLLKCLITILSFPFSVQDILKWDLCYKPV